MNPFQRPSKVVWRTRRFKLDRTIDIDSNGLASLWLRSEILEKFLSHFCYRSDLDSQCITIILLTIKRRVVSQVAWLLLSRELEGAVRSRACMRRQIRVTEKGKAPPGLQVGHPSYLINARCHRFFIYFSQFRIDILNLTYLQKPSIDFLELNLKMRARLGIGGLIL